MRTGHLWAVAVAAALPVVALGQKPSSPVTITNTPLPVEVTNPVPVTVQNPTSSVTVDNASDHPVPVVQQGTASVAVSNAPTVLAQQSGAWSVQASKQTAADYFQVHFALPAQASNLGASTSVNFPKPALVEQVAAFCDFTSPAVLTLSSVTGGPPPGFTFQPPDSATLLGQAFRADLALPVVTYPQGWSPTASLPATPVHLLVTSDITIFLYRSASDAPNSRFCSIFLFGRWLNP